jgi:hypothetical protein
MKKTVLSAPCACIVIALFFGVLVHHRRSASYTFAEATASRSDRVSLVLDENGEDVPDAVIL